VYHFGKQVFDHRLGALHTLIIDACNRSAIDTS
jgi:hypothetical protein